MTFPINHLRRNMTISGAVQLEPGVLMLIERGEAHQINNTGSEPLNTVSLYVPPAYEAATGPERD